MYTYYNLMADVKNLEKMGANIENIGKTVAGVSIPSIHIGDYSPNQIIIQGAIHAREYVTSELIVRQAYHTITKYGSTFNGGIYFVPMVNIDGVALCQYGLSAVPVLRRSFLAEVNGGSTNFTLWKANINAVDLNTNFNARWGTGVQNVRYPAPANYIGPYPNSEPETRALVELTNLIKATLTISYHAEGQEIYWEFYQVEPEKSRDKKIGEELAKITTYKLIDGTLGSAGGYKDWCIEKLKIPAYTIEIIPSSVPFPIPSSALIPEWSKNKDVPYKALNLILV